MLKLISKGKKLSKEQMDDITGGLPFQCWLWPIGWGSCGTVGCSNCGSGNDNSATMANDYRDWRSNG